MRIAGKQISGLNVIDVIIPRQTGDLHFRASAILSNDGFDKLVKEPQPRIITKVGEDPKPFLDDPEFIAKNKKYNNLYNLWLIITSLSATPDLTWDLVNPNDPETWGKLDEEFVSAGLSKAELAMLYQAVFRSNGLDKEFLEAAKKRFFAGNTPKKV